MKQIRTTLVELAVDKDTPEPRIKMAVDLIQSGVTKAVPAQGFIGVKDTMEFMGGISRVHLWHMRNLGLPSHMVGGRVVFSPKEIEAWVNNNNK